MSIMSAPGVASFRTRSQAMKASSTVILLFLLACFVLDALAACAAGRTACGKSCCTSAQKCSYCTSGPCCKAKVTSAPSGSTSSAMCGARPNVPTTGRVGWCWCAEFVWERENGNFRKDFGNIQAQDWYLNSNLSPLLLAGYKRLGNFKELYDSNRLSSTIGSIAVWHFHYAAGSHVSVVDSIDDTYMYFRGANQGDKNTHTEGSCTNVNTVRQKISALASHAKANPDNLAFLGRPRCSAGSGGTSNTNKNNNRPVWRLEGSDLDEIAAMRADQKPEASMTGDTSMNAGTIAGIVIAACVAVAVLVAVIAFVLYRRHKQQSDASYAQM